ncbi:IS3 family transposase [Paraliobacillus sp. JSM ZJ581]|uniref:IS3 family transposase n=1 Tax=Paraliobacillus sp. JSM ZJ581 TaxID=3342118 RepID=UPI0035A871F7
MSVYEVKDKGIQSNTEETSAVSAISYEVENALVNNVPIKERNSVKSAPYDNAVIEATFKTIKAKFVHHTSFDSLDELTFQFDNYVNWFNNIRIHETLGYLSPLEYEETAFKNVV